MPTVKAVWKYQIDIVSHQVVDMPKDARILCAQAQDGVPCLWALVDINAPKEPRTIRVYGTGHIAADIDQLVYVGTVQIGHFVWHVFDMV